MLSADPTAAQDGIGVVEHSGLSGSDGALWSIECDARNGGVERLDSGGRGLVFVADFAEGAKRGGGLIAGNPIHAFDFAYRLSEDVVFADDHAVLLHVNCKNVEPLAGGEAESLALAHRKILDAGVAGKRIAPLLQRFSPRLLPR